MTDKQMLKEIIERRRQWGETRDSDFAWLIDQVETLERLQEQTLYSDFISRINDLEKKIKAYQQTHENIKHLLETNMNSNTVELISEILFVISGQ